MVGEKSVWQPPPPFITPPRSLVSFEDKLEENIFAQLARRDEENVLVEVEEEVVVEG